MKTLHAFFFVLTAAAIVSQPLAAHHGRGKAYDMKTRLTLKGTVSQVKWQNPHNVVTWAFENSSVHTLATQGYNRNTLKFGDQITAIASRSATRAPVPTPSSFG